MIVYLPEPFDMINSSENNTITVKLGSGGYLIAELYEYNKLKVLSISSTDPMDYLKDNLQPGSIISLQAKID